MTQTWKHYIDCDVLKPAQIKKLQAQGAYHFSTISGSTVRTHSNFYYEKENLTAIKELLTKFKVKRETNLL